MRLVYSAPDGTRGIITKFRQVVSCDAYAGYLIEKQAENRKSGFQAASNCALQTAVRMHTTEKHIDADKGKGRNKQADYCPPRGNLAAPAFYQPKMQPDGIV